MKTLFNILVVLLIIGNTQAQEMKPTQYRRGIELQEGYQSYEQKYFGKNLNEEKRRLFPLQGTGVWTELNPKVPRVDYLGIQFVNKDTGWAVGDLGTLIKSTDGGQSWTVSETNTTTPILKVRSYNGQVVIASGFGGLILRSADGGETFTQVASGVTGDLWGLQMINDTLGIACGTANSLIKTTDAGQTWQTVPTPGYTSDYWWIDFMNETYGFIAANGKVLRTIDGGLNWEILQAGDSYPLFSIDVIDSLHIAAAGYGGTGYTAKNIYSSDSGNNWINGGMLTTSEINCIKYISLDTGYAVMSNIGLWKTTNRGQNWTITGGIGEYELQYIEERRTAYNAGTGLKLWKAEGSYYDWYRVLINDNFADVFFTSEITGYIAGGTWIGGPVYKTTNGGVSWSGIPNFPINLFTTTLACLTFTDSLTGFAGGAPCRIVKTTNAGMTWYMVNRTGLADTIGQIRKFFFINPTTGWAVTSRGGILKTIDGGDNWFAQLNAPLSIGFNSIYFVDSLYGWTANGDRPFKTIDGGQIWIQQTNLNIWESRDIYFRDSLNAFIINGIFELLRTTNSGSNWFTQFNSQYVIRNFGWLSKQHGFIVGDGVYETNDSGDTWNEILEVRNIGLRKFQSPKNYIGYSTGNLGLIYKYLDTTIVPVELTSFLAEVDNNIVTLKWSTSTETNNVGFEILKSSDNQNWNSLVFINGNGTTTFIHNYQFTFRIETSGIFYFKLKQVDYNGEYTYSNTIEVDISSPLSFELSQNYPNPFNSSTIIRYQLPKDNFISLKVYDVLGNEVKTLIEGNKIAGYYSIILDANYLSSGIYFYKLTAGAYSSTKKLILLK